MLPPKLAVVHDAAQDDDARLEHPIEEPSSDPGEALAHEGWQGLPSNVAQLPSADRRLQLRILEALLFAASEPIAESYLSQHLKTSDDVSALLEELKGFYASRGVNLVKVADKWTFRTAEDLSYLLERHASEQRRLSKAALETLAIVAYHQPVTRAEIEEIRGISASAGTLDVLMEVGWVRPRGRRRAPGRPITYGTTDEFLVHFGLEFDQGLAGVGRAERSRAARQQPAARFHGSRAHGCGHVDGRRAATGCRRRGGRSDAILRRSARRRQRVEERVAGSSAQAALGGSLLAARE